jgi:hypothetical protein
MTKKREGDPIEGRKEKKPSKAGIEEFFFAWGKNGITDECCVCGWKGGAVQDKKRRNNGRPDRWP